MKLELNLEEKPGLGHAVPLVDLIVCTLSFMMIGPMLASRGGVLAELPPTRFYLEDYQESVTITLVGRGEQLSLYVGRELMDEAAFARWLNEFKGKPGREQALVYVRTDPRLAAGVERRVLEELLQAGFKVALAGRLAPPGQ